MKYFLAIFLSFFVFSLFPNTSYAKTLPQSRTATATSKSVVKKAPTNGNIGVSAKLRRDRRALVVYFSNLQNATSVSYSLTYTGNGRNEGAGGLVRSNEGNNVTRELLFGTCSKTVCTYHQGIKNMKLEVIAELKSGKKSIKRFKVKI